MSFALIEVEATAKKAARGAGYDWGLAEEAAKATRWLCAAGFDGVAALASALQQVDGQDLARKTPESLNGNWTASSGSLCPLAAGAALSDATVFWADEGKQLAGVIAPMLLVPFAANAAQQLGGTVSVSWNGTQLVTDGCAVDVSSGDVPANEASPKDVEVRTGGEFGEALPMHTRATPSDTDWATLNRLAHRTYAPDTEESRLKGAGAGLSDND